MSLKYLFSQNSVLKVPIITSLINRLNFYRKIFYLRIVTRRFKIDSHATLAKNRINGVSYFFPYSSNKKIDRRQLYNLNKGFHYHLYLKYTDSKIKILESDVVIDCGAFVGGFSVAASLAGSKHVYCIEPSKFNFKCLQLNLALKEIRNSTALNIALGDKVGNATLNLSSSGCDNSLLEPDEGSLGKTENVKLDTLANLINKYDIDPNQLFLKVEAEGFEPEILEGLANYRPRVIVVDVTPERNGESPRNSIVELLTGYGYVDFTHTTRCLFAVKSNF